MHHDYDESQNQRCSQSVTDPNRKRHRTLHDRELLCFPLDASWRSLRAHLSFLLRSRRVAGEDIVAIFRRRVAGEAGLVQRLVARLSVLKVSEPPAGRRGVLFGVLNHELNIYDGPDKERL